MEIIATFAAMLEREFEYYKKHQDELVGKYDHKFVVVVGEEVVGAYDTLDEAFSASSERYEPGTFFIQKCTEGDGEYTQTFHSRVVFA